MSTKAADITRLIEVLNMTPNPTVREKVQKLVFKMIDKYEKELSKQEK